MPEIFFVVLPLTQVMVVFLVFTAIGALTTGVMDCCSSLTLMVGAENVKPVAER